MLAGACGLPPQILGQPEGKAAPLSNSQFHHFCMFSKSSSQSSNSLFIQGSSQIPKNIFGEMDILGGMILLWNLLILVLFLGKLPKTIRLLRSGNRCMRYLASQLVGDWPRRGFAYMTWVTFMSYEFQFEINTFL